MGRNSWRANNNTLLTQISLWYVQEMISISTQCLLSDPDNFVCICSIPVLFEFNKILFTPNFVMLYPNLMEFILLLYHDMQFMHRV